MRYRREYCAEDYKYSTRNAGQAMDLVMHFVVAGSFFLILSVLSLVIIPVPFSLIPAFYFISKPISYFLNIVDYLFFHTFRPLSKLKEWLTKTGYDSPYVTLLDGKRGPKKRVRYYTLSAFLRYGVLGNLIFWIPILFIAFTLLSYRPYGNGYVLKQSMYEIGDSVIVGQESKNIQTIITGYNSEEYVIETGESIDRNDIKGLYIEDDKNRFQQVMISDMYKLNYFKEKGNTFIEKLKK